jgi:putative flippase GtrA
MKVHRFLERVFQCVGWTLIFAVSNAFVLWCSGYLALVLLSWATDVPAFDTSDYEPDYHSNARQPILSGVLATVAGSLAAFVASFVLHRELLSHCFLNPRVAKRIAGGLGLLPVGLFVFFAQIVISELRP